MRNFLKTHWMTIAICLAYTLIATGISAYMIHSSSKTHDAVSQRMTEELNSAMAALSNANLETNKIKAARDKEKAASADLKKALDKSGKEIEELRSSLESSTQALLKASKAKAACPKIRAVEPSACRDSNSAANKAQLDALRNLQADIYRQERELREKQRKFDEEFGKLSAERDKLMQEKSAYRWPHNNGTGKAGAASK